MRLLHTGDWHVGKVLRGVSRLAEHRAVLTELVELAAAEAVDAVVVTGDVFESAAPAAEAQELAWSTLLALRRNGAEVVVIAGNHDPADTFDALAPVFAGAGITLVGRPHRPADGGVVERRIARTGELLRVALAPFVSQRGVVRAADLLALDAAEQLGAYRARYAAVVRALCRSFDGAAVNVVAAHATVTGARFGGGEREAQSVLDYSVDALCFPTTASYVALGHLHRAQAVSGPCPIWYSGSPIAVDFGEAGNTPGVVLVDVAPGRPAQVRPVPLASARRLREVHGTARELAARAAGGEFGDDLLKVHVTEPARAGLADEVRAAVPNVLEVRVAPTEPAAGSAGGAAAAAGAGGGRRSPQELFGAFLARQGIVDPRLEALFAELLDTELAGTEPAGLGGAGTELAGTVAPGERA
jgi:exonuclease SbcD